MKAESNSLQNFSDCQIDWSVLEEHLWQQIGAIPHDWIIHSLESQGIC